MIISESKQKTDGDSVRKTTIFFKLPDRRLKGQCDILHTVIYLHIIDKSIAKLEYLFYLNHITEQNKLKVKASLTKSTG